MLLKLLLLVCCLVLVQGAVVPVKNENISPIIHFLSDGEMPKFLSEYPNAIKLSRENISISKSAASDEVFELGWTLGARASGDKLVYEDISPIHYYDEYSSPYITVEYPEVPGTGAIITKVDVTTWQSLPLGDAYLVIGGIGYRGIVFYVTSYFTNFWKWDIKIYGKP